MLWEEQGGGGEVLEERGLFLWVVMERLRQQDEQVERDRVALGRMAGMLPVDPAAEGGGPAGPARRDSAADVELLHQPTPGEPQREVQVTEKKCFAGSVAWGAMLCNE